MAHEYPDASVYDTVPKLLRYNAERFPDDIALREKDFGVWTEFTWAQYLERVRNLALALSEAGLVKGDVFSIIGDSNVDWICAELAAQSVGAMTIGFYRDVLEDEIAYLTSYSAARMTYAEDQEQVDKFLNLGDRAGTIEKIIYSNPRGMRKFDDPRIISFDDLVARGAEIHAKSPELFDQMVDAVTGEDVAILCTTSGTTSNPKLAELQHGNFVRHTQIYLRHDPKDSTDEYVSMLPMPWIMEQVYTIGFGLNSRMKVSFPESEETAMSDLREIGPTFLLFAPRVLEQIAADMRARVMDAGPLTQWIFDKGVALGRAALDKGGRSWIADIALFSALRDRLGFSNVRSAATGGAAMGPDTFKLFLAMGVPLRQLYGQTELLGAYTLQDGREIDVDTVGVPFDGCEVKIIDADKDGVGEIVTRHPNMFRGFYKNDEATKGDMKDGWMHTGDAGFFDAKGRLTVIDRVKDIAQTRTGTKFSPQFIENKLKFSPYIGEAVILGADQDYLTAIICVRFSIISKWAEKARIPFTSYTNLSDRPEIYDLIRSETAHVNKSLPNAQKIRKFILLFKELDADDGELTRTRKVRRSVIAERYGPIIEALYSDSDRAEISSEVTFEDGRKGTIEASMKIMQVDGAAVPVMKKAG